jgi:hypothetical protein
MDWILRNIPLLAFIFVLISIVRAVLRAREMQGQDQQGRNESEQERRVREVQEEIRRKIAERRGERHPNFPARPLTPEQHRPLVFERHSQPQPADSPGGRGPVRRLLEQLEERLEVPLPPVLAPVPPVSNRPELERQFRIEDELRAAEDLRQQTRPRAMGAAAAKEAASLTKSALRASARERLLADLSDSQSVRRAFVLREVLGPPAGLR